MNAAPPSAMPPKPASKRGLTKILSEPGERKKALLWQRLVLAAMLVVSRRVRALSRPAALRFGTRLGNTAYRVAGSKRKRALKNLRLAYGDTLDDAQRDKLVREVFQHFGRCIVDFLHVPSIPLNEFSRLVTSEGWEHVEKGMAHGKGIVLVTAHIGNWEVLGRWLAQMQELPLTVVAREPPDEAFATYVRQIREGSGFTVLNKGQSARDLLRVLRRQEAICLLPDQNSGDVFAPFFGIPAGTVAGPASLAFHTGAPLVPIYCLQMPDGSYHVFCLPPIDTHSSGNKEADTVRVMTEVNRTLEEVVRRYPSQWLWLHNRWKSAFDEHNRERAWSSNEERQAAYYLWHG